MSVLSFAVMLPPLLIGIVIVLLLYPYSLRSHLLLKVFLGIGVGMGLSSILFFVWILFFSPHLPGFVLIEFLILAFLLAALLYRYKKMPCAVIPEIQGRSRPIWASWLLLVLFLGSFLSWVIAFRSFSFTQPHGTFDAYAIWNLRARFIFRAGEDWQIGLSPDLNWKNHADYPMLTSANIARAWVILRQETTRVPIVLSGLFTTALLGLSLTALHALRGWGQAALGSILLLAIPWITYFPPSQNAETVVAYFYLAVSTLLMLYAWSRSANFLVLAGLMAGLSAWVKNEGLVFLVAAAFGSLALVYEHKKTLRAMLARFLPFLYGAVPPLAVALFFKFRLTPANDLFAGQILQDFLLRILDPTRWSTILSSLGDLIWRMGEFGFPLLPGILVILLIFFPRRMLNRKGLQTILLVLLLTAFCYFLVYLVTPHPLEWHLQYSADRLLFQLLPSFWLTFFIFIRTPEEIIQPYDQD